MCAGAMNIFERAIALVSAIMLSSMAHAADQPPHSGPRGLAVPAHYMGMLVIVQGGPPPADAEEVPAYITGVLNTSGGFHDHHKVQGSDRVLPAHQITLTRMSSERPTKTLGYWVIPGPLATPETVRVQANPERSLLDAPLATALRIGNEWLPLDSHVVIEYGIATGQLALRYFSQGGSMTATWMQPTPQPFAVEVTTTPAVKLPPRGPEPPPPAMPADADAGRTKAGGCSGCHGTNGISVNQQWPNLAGQRKAYLVKQLHSFRSGERRDAIMNSFAGPLTDEDIEQIAEYYSSLPALPPP